MTLQELPIPFVDIYHWEMCNPLIIYNNNGIPFEVRYRLEKYHSNGSNLLPDEGWNDLVCRSNLERPSLMFSTFNGGNEMHLKFVHGLGKGFVYTRHKFNLLAGPHMVPDEFQWVPHIVFSCLYMVLNYC